MANDKPSTSTVSHYNLQNKIPDIHKMVTDMSPWRTWCWTKFKTKRAKQTKYTWTRYDKRAASASNQQQDAKTFTADASVEPHFVGNYCQISDQNIQVDNRVKVSKTTGKTDMSDRTKEAMLAVKYDCETAILGTQVPTDSAAATSPGQTIAKTASLTAWIASHTDMGTGGTPAAPAAGTDGIPTSTGTAGTTARAFTKSQLDGMLLSIEEGSSGMADTVIMNPRLKMSFDKMMIRQGATSSSNYNAAGVMAPQQDYGSKPSPKGVTVQGAVMLYNSTFGQVEIMSSKWSKKDKKDSIIHILDTSAFCLVFLRKMHMEDMGIRGDFRERTVRVDWGTYCKEDKTSAQIRAINYETAVAA